jgi:outer membrane receptor protein involved in Fe transport
LKIQALIPNPVLTNVNVNNYPFDTISQKRQKIPGFTLDHSLGSTGHLSSYWSDTISHQIFSVQPWPIPLSQSRIARVTGQVIRLNYTDAISPNKIIQLGTGYMKYYDPDSSPDSVLAYDAVGNLGLKGAAIDGFPNLNMGLNGSYGGSNNFGPTNANHYHNDKITENASLTWTLGTHTLKFGGNFFIDTWGDENEKGSSGVFNFGSGQTGNFDPLQTLNSGGGIGFAYASYLLGLASTATTQPYEAPYVRRRSWALYAQDSWRATPKLTVTYGLRWDYNGWMTEKHNRMSEFSPTTAIPTLGANVMGGLIYAGSGAGTCNCDFVKPYWLNISPRVGLAYQLDPKTVFRGGAGLSYGQPASMGWFTNNSNLFYGVGWNVINFQTSQFDGAGAVLGQGLNYDHSTLTTATIGNPAAGAYIPTLTAPTGIQSNAPWIMDPNLNKLPRILSWSVGLQRQLTSDIMVEASWVGNHGVREYSTFNQINVPNPATLKARGIDVTNPATQAILEGTIGSAAAQTAGFSLPYATFPTNTTVIQSLRPYPEYTGVTDEWGNQGGSTYQSLQSKLTKRGKNGLTVSAAFTWSKAYSRVACDNNVFDGLCMDLSGSDQPFLFVVGFSYELQKFGSNKILNAIVPGWTLGGLGDYGSGTPLGVPGQSGSPNTSSVLLQSSRALRIPGVPLYLEDINCHCYDPSKQQILNPAAWANPAIGTFAGTAPYFSDFRAARRPAESASFGRKFRIHEHVTFLIRAEFFNVFNRTYFAGPSTSLGPVTTSGGLINGGFGTINVKSGLYTGPRNGQIVARIQF